MYMHLCWDCCGFGPTLLINVIVKIYVTEFCCFGEIKIDGCKFEKSYILNEAHEEEIAHI